MKPSTKDQLKSALFEAFFVVLAICLAYIVNEWSENKKQQKQADHALHSIFIELEENRKSLESSAAYHQTLLTMIQANVESNLQPSIRDFPKGFAKPAQLFDTAWQTATETGVIQKMDYDMIIELSRLYVMQDQYMAQTKIIGEIIYNELFNNGTQQIIANYRNLGTIIMTLRYREKPLIKQLEDFLKKHDDLKAFEKAK